MKGKLLIAIFLFLFCTLSIEAFAIEPLFDTGIDYPTGDLPESFCSGDFNKDGFRDLIVVDAANDKILVFLNDKKNGFKNPIGYETGDWPSSIATADFNGDSYLDVVVITDSENSSDNLNILFNAADGTFMPPISYTIDEGGRFIRNHVLAVADVNGDGHQDIVVSNTKDTLFVFLNSGKGSFDKPIANIVRDGPHTLCAADFNQDGLVDIAGVRSDYDNYSICVFYSTAAGTFQAPLYYPTGRSPRHSIIASDFNNDPFIDLAVACFGEWDFTVSHRANSSLVVLLNQKDGAFKQVFEHTETGPLSLCAADFNGDTIKDLAVTYRAEHDNEPHNLGIWRYFWGKVKEGSQKRMLILPVIIRTV
jgi:hypothetical protein